MRFEVVAALFLLCSSTGAFTQPGWTSTTSRPFGLDTSATWKLMSAQDTVTETSILGALRSAAMSLHTTRQAPKEGKVEVKEPQERYVPTHDDYLAFLVDSQVVYEALEEIVNSWEELSVFRDNGLERTKPLDIDIDFMVKEYDLQRPEVGSFGTDYAAELRRIREEGSIPEFMCHYYNFYFAHTAGGRMIGKQMSALLLDKKTLEFYKWEGNINELKDRVKGDIEDLAAGWSQEEKDECVAATAATFRFAGAINKYLSGGKSSH